ncbi:hypothetical protein ACOSQ3_028515 [Xanthoceras sorbifolium]
MSSLGWLLADDFNEILFSHEKCREQLRADGLMCNFREALADCELNDLGYKGCDFTWCNGRDGAAFVQARLDRAVCNFAWRNLFSHSFVSHLNYWRSDHRPIVIKVLDGPLIPPRQQVGRRFQFNACWIHEKVCEDLVAESWSRVGEISNDVVRAVLGGIALCSSKLKNWYSTHNITTVRQQINQKKFELQRVNLVHNSIDWNRLQTVETELNQLLNVEESY